MLFGARGAIALSEVSECEYLANLEPTSGIEPLTC